MRRSPETDDCSILSFAAHSGFNTTCWSTFLMNTNAPPPLPPLPNQDAEHLRLLSVFHTILAVIGALFACFPLVHVVMGLAMMGGGSAVAPGAPVGFGLLFAGMGMVAVCTGWALAICTFLSGRFIARRRRRMFSFVLAAILCAFPPFGTALGVFTLIVLNRDSVQRLYALT